MAEPLRQIRTKERMRKPAFIKHVKHPPPAKSREEMLHFVPDDILANSRIASGSSFWKPNRS